MKINGNNYNFGRVVYLTIGKIASDPYLFNGQTNKLTNVVTIVFDPRKNPQYNTRLDFLVRHQYGSVSNVTGSAYALAAIDIYNIGPALQQFMNAYNAYESDGHWKSTNVSKYVCTLEVGYSGMPRQIIFAGAINSYNVERKQSEASVDTVWHLFCAGTGGYSPVSLSMSELATSGEDMFKELQNQNTLLKSYVSGESYIKDVIKSQPRTIYQFTDTTTEIIGDSFNILKDDTGKGIVLLQQPPRDITNTNFNLFFEIKYMAFNSGQEDEWVKNMWQNESFLGIGNIDSTDLASTLNQIAARRNCKADIRLDESTGKQIIYIYSPRSEAANKQKNPNWVITDFKNLRKPPLVSGKSIRFDLLLEPEIRPHHTIELRLTNDFIKKQKIGNGGVPSFGVNFANDAGQWSTVFAGANFDGLSNVVVNNKTKQSMKQTGNIFNKRYMALFVIHQGTTHDKEWSTTVDCVGVKMEG